MRSPSALAKSRQLWLLVLSASVAFATAAPAALDVPFIAQEPNYCGPAALAMLAHYYGHAVSQNEIAREIYLPEISGTLSTELSAYARKFHLWVRQYRGSVDDLRQKLSAGVPLIVLGKFGRQPHYFVVLDVDPRREVVTVHSDTRPRHEMRLEDFLRHWDRADRWTMLVCPPDRATWRLDAEEENDLGVFLERDGQLVEAEKHYRAATGLRPGNSYYRMNLGNALLKQGKSRDAAAEFAAAVKLDSENADAMNNLANAYLEVGENLDDAASLCEQAVQLRPSRRACYLDTLGSVRLKQQKVPEAIAAFADALQSTTDRQGSLRADIEQRLAAARALVEK